ELVQHGLGISVLPPMSVRSVTAQVSTIPITPPLRRDIGAVVAATRPPTGAAQALLDLLAPAAALGEARARSVRDLIGACQPAGKRRERQQGIEISRNF